MAVDSAEKRNAMLAIDRGVLVVPSGSDLDALFERLTMLGIYAGFAAGIGSVSTSQGARQRCRRIGSLGRV